MQYMTPSQFAWSDLSTQTEFNGISVPEPELRFLVDGEIVLTIKSTGVFYNLEKYPSDTFKIAANRVMQAFSESILPHVEPDYAKLIRIDAWKNAPEKIMYITTTGIEHNFELDTWHWWMFEELNKLIKNKFKK